MKKIMGHIKSFAVLCTGIALISSCAGKQNVHTVDASTGIEYATEKSLIGFKPYNDKELPNPPGMVFVQGGRTILGSFEQDLFGAKDNIERTVTVNSFFMDETEKTNAEWRMYVFQSFNPIEVPLPKNVEVMDPNDDDLIAGGNAPDPFVPDYEGQTHSRSNPKTMEEIIPDDDVWTSDFSFNDVYAENYYSNPGYSSYPVVGVTWRQIADFCRYRTETVNLQLIFAMDREELPLSFQEEFFTYDDTSQEYSLAIGGQPLGDNTTGVQQITVQDLDDYQQEIVEFIIQPTNRRQFIERGIYLPDFRLPNEAEWEYAAKATIGTVYLDENEEYGRIYPWDGRGTRNPYGKERGTQLANFKRGRGDYAGIAGNINNDGAVIPEQVGLREPNDFNLFNMAGNVSEWVFDTYRPLSFGDFDDLNPVRKDGTGDSEELYGWQSSQVTDSTAANTLGEYRSLVNDRSKVYKGGSWKDVAYWMAPGTRRYLDMDRGTNTIGFRCAMISIGTQQLDQNNGLLGGILGGK